MRCLGITNPSMIVAGNGTNHHRESPSSKESMSPPPTSSLSHGSSTAVGTAITSVGASIEKSVHIGNDSAPDDNEFTLMHPAFQSVQSKRKTFNCSSSEKYNPLNVIEPNRIVLPSIQSAEYEPRSTASGANILTNGKLRNCVRKLSASVDAKYLDSSNGQIMDDSSDSEEIDLTSNGCIDFSNNNHSGNDNHNRPHNNTESDNKC